MRDLSHEVIEEMLLLRGRSLFTVYDITRRLQSKHITHINHDEVRSTVEAFYRQAGLRRDIGYHLSFSPPPQIYYVTGQDINDYDPDALDPANVNVTAEEAEVATIPVPRTVQVLAVPVQTEYLFALVDKHTGKRAVPFKGNSVGLYKTRNGPNQLKSNHAWNPDYEVVRYEVILKPVGN